MGLTAAWESMNSYFKPFSGFDHLNGQRAVLQRSQFLNRD